eukprot:scaffold38586_cov281-Isochrysis_galbana.AAC.2
MSSKSFHIPTAYVVPKYMLIWPVAMASSIALSAMSVNKFTGGGSHIPRRAAPTPAQRLSCWAIARPNSAPFTLALTLSSCGFDAEQRASPARQATGRRPTPIVARMDTPSPDALRAAEISRIKRASGMDGAGERQVARHATLHVKSEDLGTPSPY